MIVSPHITERYFKTVCCLAILCMISVMSASLFFGAVPIKALDIFTQTFDTTSQMHMIVMQIRLPRVLLAASIGAILATCGAVTQGLFRNPLADPSIIGVSAGASAGASIVIVCFSYLNMNIYGLSLVSIGAFFGAILAVIFVYKLATNSNGTSVTTMLLAGIALSFFAGSISSFFEYIADNDMLKRISLWRMGGVDSANYVQVIIAASVAVGLFIVLPKYIHALNAFLLGESEARHMGINVTQTKRVLVICVAAGVGISVALAGTIAFVGLVVPHVVRLIVGANHKFVMPLSACLGACLLVLADTIARVILSPQEIPVGLITSFIGAPVFILLLKNRYRHTEHS